MSDNNLLKEVEGSYERLTEDELGNLGVVLGGYRSFRGNRRAHIAYVSMPITSGKRLYDVLAEEGVRTIKELSEKCGKDTLWERVIQPNVVEGVALADTLGRREDLLFIAPSVFEAKRWRWSEDAYMSLWYRVIGEMAGKLVMSDGWEFSNGGVDEVLFALYLRWRILNAHTLKIGAREFQLKNFLPGMSPDEIARELEAMWQVRIFDTRGEEIRIESALERCIGAVEYLKERKFPYDTLLSKAWQMMKIPYFTPNFYEPYCENASIFTSGTYMKSRQHIHELGGGKNF